MPQSKSRKIAILGYRSVGEWRRRRCPCLSPRTRPGLRSLWRRGHVAGGWRAFHNLHFEWRRRRLLLSPGAADRWRGPWRPGPVPSVTVPDSCGRSNLVGSPYLSRLL